MILLDMIKIYNNIYIIPHAIIVLIHTPINKCTLQRHCRKQSAKSSFFLCFSNIGIQVA